ncbi:hypothetical protein [Microbacterium thalassium]|uniref:Uncharacterized protein n=1 Tax=Microbacterium thalassium TaxID=362649 RepID=A0A7X0FM47_9MICO|nr:hypothetical protein [Microbacterium thalassium]MBB6390023.1 hypothetical protein [Microbacterium thalassium]
MTQPEVTAQIYLTALGIQFGNGPLSQPGIVKPRTGRLDSMCAC